tara:strand:+ start:236 stop:760 length:525 start_codon:yes stop_codon:yes gene_type:complete
VIDPNQDELSHFADWYLSGKVDRVYTPIKNGLLFIEGISGIVLYRSGYFQVELFICQPNTVIPEHTHPDVDSYECFLHGMKFTHSGETITSHKQASEQQNGYPTNLHGTIRVRPNEVHGGTASNTGGAFISIQHWLNGVEPSNVSSNWSGDLMGDSHTKQVYKTMNIKEDSGDI